MLLLIMNFKYSAAVKSSFKPHCANIFATSDRFFIITRYSVRKSASVYCLCLCFVVLFNPISTFKPRSYMNLNYSLHCNVLNKCICTWLTLWWNFFLKRDCTLPIYACLLNDLKEPRRAKSACSRLTQSKPCLMFDLNSLYWGAEVWCDRLVCIEQ